MVLLRRRRSILEPGSDGRVMPPCKGRGWDWRLLALLWLGASATGLIPIYCEWIEALGSLRWSCFTAVARFLNPVPAFA
jgi:hypothetical protein